MTRALLIIFAVLINVNWFIAQTYFLRSYDFGTVEYIYQVLEYKDRIYLSTATWCGAECSFLSEVDLDGNILWKAEVPDIDIAQGTMVVVNDTITITGNNDQNNESFQMAHFTLEGQKIGETITIEHPTRKFTKMFQLTTQYFSDKYAICGTGKLADNVHYSLIYVVNKNGSLDTLITLNQTSNTSVIWDSFIDSQGRLTTLHWIEDDGPDINFRKIYKFNENLDTVWSYQTENNSSDLTVPRSCELLDGRTALAYINPVGDPFLHSIRAVDPDGNLDWQYDYQWTGSRTREIYRLKTLRNGDILGSGQYSEFEENPTIGDSPWLFRMSQEGELLWEHVYYEFDSTLPPNGSSRRGTLFDFVELSNGDILAVGTIKYDDSDMLVMKVDSNGCLDARNCQEANILTYIPDISLKSIDDIFIYPNPAHEKICVDFDSPVYSLDIDVLDISGQRVAFGNMINGHIEMNTFDLPMGVYLVNVIKHGQIEASGKFVKSEK